MDLSRLIVALCTYNERQNIEQLVPEVQQFLPDADILIVDDNSPDGTGQFADQLAETDSRIKVVHRPEKLGLGTALVAAIQFAIDGDYETLVVMDADFSHQPKHLPALVECLHRVDVGIGSRYVPGGGVEGWGLRRHFMSRAINWYTRLLLRLQTRDNSGSFRCYRVSRLAELDLHRIRSHGYAIQEEMLYRCRRVGCTFEETPIIFDERRYGESKISIRVTIEALWVILRLGIENLLGTQVKTPEE